MIILIVIIFIFVTKDCLRYIMEDFGKINENFDNINSYKPSNVRLLYRNVNELPWERHSINSSIPFDVTVKKEANMAYYYEYDNKTYENKLKQVFNSNCEELIIAVEGTNWGKWLNPKKLDKKNEIEKIVGYYNNIFNVIKNKLNEKIMDLPGNDKQKKIQIVHDLLLRYRCNKDNNNYCMFDIEMILYREGKLQGKHVKMVVVTNGIKVNVIMVKIIGVVSEDNIALYPYSGNDTMNETNFDIFIPEKDIVFAVNQIKNEDKIYADSIVNNDLENVMYNKLLENYNPEDIDISNNTYIPKKEELVNKNICNI